MRALFKSSRLLQTALLALAGCGSGATPLPPKMGCEGETCKVEPFQPCSKVHEWSLIQFGSDLDDVGVSIGADDECNVYISGTTRGLIQPVETSSEPGGMMDVFVARIPAVAPGMSMDSPEYWLKQVGSPADDAVKELVVSGAGDVYLAGNTAGLVPGESELEENQGYNDTFAMKFGADGGRRWSKQYGSVEEDQGLAVALAPSGDLLVLGTSLANPYFGYEITLDTLTPAGVLTDHFAVGTDNHDRGEGLAIHAASGDLFITGSTLGDLGAPNRGSLDSYVWRLSLFNPQGGWMSQVATPDIDGAFDLVIDNTRGFLFVLAVSMSDLVTGANENDGIQNSFLIKYRVGSSTPEWVKRIGTKQDYNRSLGITLDDAGNVYVAGFTTGSVEVGVSNKGGRDAYVARFRGTDGVRQWARQLGTSGNDEATDVVLTRGGDVVISGLTSGDLDSTGDNNHYGRQDAFVARFDPSQD